MSDWTFDEVKAEVEPIRARINTLRTRLSDYFVDKGELIDLICTCTVAQEPLLLVGKPGTAKSDLIVKFAQALGLQQGDYFEYMLTKFTEPSEVVGPIDINELREGRYVRRVGGKLPEARLVFLDEIFKSNSAILNTLLTIINERKYYQDGRPVPVKMRMLFAATNDIPEFAELAALRDRFPLKVPSLAVRDRHFDALIDKGLELEGYKAFGQRPWEGMASLEDFLKLKTYLDHVMTGRGRAAETDRERYFPPQVYGLFKRILRTLEKEDRIEISDRKVIKLYKLCRARAFLLHGGVVARGDLVLLRYVADRTADMAPVRDKVDALLRL